MNRTQRILHTLLDDIAGFFPYFFGFYIFSLLLSFVFHSWKLFFNWELFTLCVVVLGIASLFSSKARHLFTFILSKWRGKALIHGVVSNIKNVRLPSAPKINLPDISKHWQKLVQTTREILSAVRRIMVDLWKRLGRGGQIKIVLILAVLIFALTRGIGVIDFVVLAYALASVLFIFESRIPAVLALVLLAACPFFLMFKKDTIAETLAIYAYYFLVITVMTQIAEHIEENRATLPTN